MSKLQDTLNKGIDTGYDALAKITSVAGSNSEKIGKTIVNTILLIIIFAVFGCFDFLTMSFHFEYLSSVAFWTKVITKAIAGICAYNIGVNISWDRELEKDLLLIENAKKYERLNKMRDNKSFNKFIVEIFNPEEKKRAYIVSINKKLYWLDKFSTNKSKLLYSLTSDNEEKQKEIDNLKAKNRYCIKRKELEELKSEEYIAKNIDSISVRYSYVDPIVFDMDIDGKSTYKGVKVKGSTTQARAKKTSSVMMSMICVSAFLTSIGLDANQEQFENQVVAFWHYVLTCAEDVGVILWKVLSGVFASRKMINSEITRPLVDRNMILTKYLEWCVENNIETSKAKQIYDKIVESENKLTSEVA